MHRKIFSIILASMVFVSFVAVADSYGADKGVSLRVEMTGHQRVEEKLTSNFSITKKEAAEFSKVMRYYILKALYMAGSGHANTALSDPEILMVLYTLGEMLVDHTDPKWAFRDRLITKGHGYMSLYTILALTGFFSTEELEQVRSIESFLSGHVTVETPGCDTNAGILGQPVTKGLGMAIGAKKQGTNFITTVIAGDAELGEGEMWEGFRLAPVLMERGKAGKMIVIIDDNGVGRDGASKDQGIRNVEGQLQSFGWDVTVVEDGHNPFAIKEAYARAKKVEDKQSVIVCKTQKGKGVSFLSEDGANSERHGTPPKDANEYFKAIKEVLGKEVPRGQYKEVHGKRIEIDNTEETLSKFLDMDLIARVIAKVKGRNANNRRKLEAKLAKQPKNPLLEPIKWEWDKKQTRHYDPGTQISTRKAAGEFFVHLLDTNPQLCDRFVFITMDLKTSEVVNLVTDRYPQTDLMIGISEQAGINIAAGLASIKDPDGNPCFLPVFGTFGAFVNNMAAGGRMAYYTPETGILVWMSHMLESLELGGDGETHQAVEALAVANDLGFNPRGPIDGNRMWDWLYQSLNELINKKSGPIVVAGARGTAVSSTVLDLNLPDPTVDSFVVYESEGISSKTKPDAIIVTAGPTMVNFSTQAAKLQEKEGKKIRVICVEHFNVINEKDSAFYRLIEPGVPIYTTQDSLERFLAGLVSDAVTNISEDRPAVRSRGIHGIPKTRGITKGKTYLPNELMQVYAAYELDPTSISKAVGEMIAGQGFISLAEIKKTSRVTDM